MSAQGRTGCLAKYPSPSLLFPYRLEAQHPTDHLGVVHVGSPVRPGDRHFDLVALQTFPEGIKGETEVVGQFEGR